MKVVKIEFSCDVCSKKTNVKEKNDYPKGWFNLKSLELEVPEENLIIGIAGEDYCSKQCFINRISDELKSIKSQGTEIRFKEEDVGFQREIIEETFEQEKFMNPEEVRLKAPEELKFREEPKFRPPKEEFISEEVPKNIPRRQETTPPPPPYSDGFDEPRNIPEKKKRGLFGFGKE